MQDSKYQQHILVCLGLSCLLLFAPHHSLTQTLLERLVNATQQDFVVAHLTHAVVERRATPTNTNRKRVCRIATTCATALSPNKQHVRARKALANGAVAQTLHNEFVAFDHFVLVASQVHHWRLRASGRVESASKQGEPRRAKVAASRVLLCIVLYFVVLCCIALCCVVLCCIALSCAQDTVSPAKLALGVGAPMRASGVGHVGVPNARAGAHRTTAERTLRANISGLRYELRRPC